MQLWFNRASEVSIREHLVTQVVLGILSGDLAPGQRLPSTRELARRFKLHPNTASAGYRQLEREGWLESRCGSGVFVRPGVRKKNEVGARPSGDPGLEQLISDLLISARKLGIPLTRVHTQLRERLDQPPPDHFLLIEADEELRRIVAAEIQRAVDFPVESAGLEVCESPAELRGAIRSRCKARLKSQPKLAAVRGIDYFASPLRAGVSGWMASRSAERAGRCGIAMAGVSQDGPDHASGQRISSRHPDFSRRSEEKLAARA